MRPLRDPWSPNQVSGAGMTRAAAAKLDEAQLDNLVPKFAKPEHIHIVVAGSDARASFQAPFMAGSRARWARNRSRAR